MKQKNQTWSASRLDLYQQTFSEKGFLPTVWLSTCCSWKRPLERKNPICNRISFQALRHYLISITSSVKLPCKFCIHCSYSWFSAPAKRWEGIHILGLDTVLGYIYIVKLKSKELHWFIGAERLLQHFIPTEKTWVLFCFPNFACVEVVNIWYWHSC